MNKIVEFEVVILSDFNKVIAFHQIMPYLDKVQQDNLASTLGMNLEEIERRLVGKEKEDEFVLMLIFTNSCKSITGFDEGVSQLLETATSDLLVELKNGKKFMLEIKHTDKEKYSISSGNLQKRIEYAKKYYLDLYFAISIKGFWMLFHSDYLKKKTGKIEVSDMFNSELDDTLGCISYIFPKGLKIKSVYTSNDNPKTMGIKFEPYGNLLSYELYYGSRKIFRVKGKDSPLLGLTMILEALQDRMSMDSQTITRDGEYTIIIEQFTNEFNAISEYKFLLSVIEHTISDYNTKYDVHSYIEKAKEDKSILEKHVSLEHVRGMMQYLVDNGVKILYSKKQKIYEINSRK